MTDPLRAAHEHNQEKLPTFTCTYNRLAYLLDKNKVNQFKKELINALAEGFPIDFIPYGYIKTILSQSVDRIDLLGHDIVLFILNNGADIDNVLDRRFDLLDKNNSAELLNAICKNTKDINKLRNGETIIGALCLKFMRSLSSNLEKKRIDLIKIALKYGADPYLDIRWQKPWIQKDKRLSLLSVDLAKRRIDDLNKLFSVYLTQKDALSLKASNNNLLFAPYEYEL